MLRVIPFAQVIVPILTVDLPEFFLGVVIVCIRLFHTTALFDLLFQLAILFDKVARIWEPGTPDAN